MKMAADGWLQNLTNTNPLFHKLSTLCHVSPSVLTATLTHMLDTEMSSDPAAHVPQ